MQRGIILLLVGLLLGVSGCANGVATPTATDWQRATITLERQACLGNCPVYVVTIQGDGTVFYKGVAHTSFIGTRQGTVEPAKVQQLVAAFDAANFWTLPDSYTGGPTDQPTTITTLADRSRHKSVNRYGGSPDAPPSLIQLEDSVDSVLAGAHWTR